MPCLGLPLYFFPFLNVVCYFHVEGKHWSQKWSEFTQLGRAVRQQNLKRCRRYTGVRRTPRRKEVWQSGGLQWPWQEPNATAAVPLPLTPVTRCFCTGHLQPNLVPFPPQPFFTVLLAAWDCIFWSCIGTLLLPFTSFPNVCLTKNKNQPKHPPNIYCLRIPYLFVALLGYRIVVDPCEHQVFTDKKQE